MPRGVRDVPIQGPGDVAVSLTVYTGTTATISTASGPIQLLSAANVTVATGASVTGDGVLYAGKAPTPAILSDSSTLTLQHGTTITAGSDSGFGSGPAVGIQSSGDTFVSSDTTGPTVTGGAGTYSGGAGLLLRSPASLTLTAGTYTGGVGTIGYGGAGIIVRLTGSQTATIGGSNLHAVAGTGGNGSGYAAQLMTSGTSVLTVAGGSYSGTLFLAPAESSSIKFTGSGLAVSSGVLSGTLTDGTAISATIVGGTAGFVSSGSGASVTFSSTAPSLLHHAINGAAGSSVTTSVTSTTAGNLLVAAVGSYSAGPATMPAGWIKALDYSTNPYVGVWYYPNNPGSITSVTATATNPILWVGEVANISAPSMIFTGTASGATGAISGAAVSPDVAAFMVGVFVNDNADTATTPTGGFAITDQTTRGANNGTAVLTQAANGGTYTPGCTLPGGHNFAAITVAFRQ